MSILVGKHTLMKNILFLGLVFLCLGAKAQLGTIKHLDEKNGFAGIELGDTISNIKLKTAPQIGAAKVDKFGVATYTIAADSLLNIGNEVPLKAISVDFLDGKVYAINLYFNPADAAKVHTALIKAYGKSTKGSEAHTINWVGKKVSLAYAVNVKKPDQHISFTSIRLNKLFQSRYDSSAKKTASSL